MFDIRTYDIDSDDFKKALILRYNILDISGGIGDSGVKFIFGSHENERNHTLIGTFMEDKIVGTLNLEPIDDTTFLLRQFAVDGSMQGTGIGTKMMDFTHKYAREHGYRKIIMHARETALNFYKKNGYITTGEIDYYPTLTLHHMYIDL